MLHYAVVVLVIALIISTLGFIGITASATGIAKIQFIVFLVLAVASLLFGLVRKNLRRPAALTALNNQRARVARTPRRAPPRIHGESAPSVAPAHEPRPCWASDDRFTIAPSARAR
jgi:uncharacterized membrane protein YtjA (UPF0391 family)